MGGHGDLESAFAAEVPWDDMDVEVGDALSSGLSNVSEDVDSLGAEDAHFGLSDALGDVIDLMHDFHRAGEEIVIVGLWNDEGVAFGGLADVEDCDDVIVLVDDVAGDLPIDDAAEDVFHMRAYLLINI